MRVTTSDKTRQGGFGAVLLGLIHPALAPGLRRKWWLWALHLLLVAVVLVALYFLGVSTRLHERIPGKMRFLAQAWLSILFLLTYLLLTLGWWLWELLAAPAEDAYFPDLDLAWGEAVAALNKAGLAVTERPLFLVLGQPEGGDNALFEASQLSWKVSHSLPQPDPPIRVYGNADGIYVTCAGASLLGRQAAVLAGRAAAVEGAPAEAEAYDPMGRETLRPETAPRGAREIRDITSRSEREHRDLTEEERRELRRIVRRDRPHVSLLKFADQVELMGARLRYLCRLIARSRYPYCPVNGILLLIPLAGSDSDQDAIDTGEICQRDLTAARQALRVNCPVFALLCDLETVAGFPEFLARFSAEERRQRVGQRCPLRPDFRLVGRGRPGGGPSPQAAMVQDLIEWVCNSVVPGWVYKKFQPGDAGQEGVKAAIDRNALLFLFFDDLRERQKRLSAILSRAVEGPEDDPLLFGGCYLGGTGRESRSEQGFVSGVFARLLDEQDHVSWTDQALAEESAGRRWVAVTYALLAVVVAGAAGLVVYSLFGGKGK
jgi:hypothetical protein